MSMILDPNVAAAQYLAGGCNTVDGMPTRAELEALVALSAADRLQWGQEVAAAFARQVPKRADGVPLALLEYDSLTGIVEQAEDYLHVISRQNPKVGLWRWNADDVPELPAVISVMPHGEHWIATAKIGRLHAEVQGPTEEAARAGAQTWIDEQVRP